MDSDVFLERSESGEARFLDLLGKCLTRDCPPFRYYSCTDALNRGKKGHWCYTQGQEGTWGYCHCGTGEAEWAVSDWSVCSATCGGGSEKTAADPLSDSAVPPLFMFAR